MRWVGTLLSLAWHARNNNNNRAPYRYIGNAPVLTAGVAFPGYPATGAHAADSGRDTGPRTWWGVTCTPTETKPRQKEKWKRLTSLSSHASIAVPLGGHARTSSHKWAVVAP